MNYSEIFKISVVLPMFNAAQTIVKTLDSIKQQTFLKCIEEIIVVNDGSTDLSRDIVNEYMIRNPEMNIQIVDKKNGGVSSARNEGLKRAKGNWVALIDSDDQWLTNKIEWQVKTISENPNIDFLGGDMEPRGLSILGRKIDHLYKAKISDICLKVFPQTSTAIFKKSIFEEIGGYDESLRYGEDVQYFMDICIKYNYYHLPRQMVKYGDGKRGFGVSGLSANLKKMHEGSIRAIEKLLYNRVISRRFYLFLRFFYLVKYARRILMTKWAKISI